MFFIDKILGFLHGLAVKYTPNTEADENAIEELRAFLKSNPPLKFRAFDVVKLLFQKGPDNDDFKEQALDLLFDIVLAKASTDRID